MKKTENKNIPNATETLMEQANELIHTIKERRRNVAAKIDAAEAKAAKAKKDFELVNNGTDIDQYVSLKRSLEESQEYLELLRRTKGSVEHASKKENEDALAIHAAQVKRHREIHDDVIKVIYEPVTKILEVMEAGIAEQHRLRENSLEMSRQGLMDFNSNFSPMDYDLISISPEIKGLLLACRSFVKR